MADRLDSAVVAVDIGSTAARAGVFDASGRLLARGSHPFDTGRPAPEHAEHSSDEIWRACCRSVRAAISEARLDPASVRGLAFDATCSLALFDEHRNPPCVAAAASDIHAGLGEACKAMVRSGREVAPDARVVDFFDRRYESFLLLHRHRQAVDQTVATSSKPSEPRP